MSTLDSGTSEGPDRLPVRLDCRGRDAKEILLEAIPICLQARTTGATPVLSIENLEGLNDSVSRLLKAFDRLAADFGARIKLADSSGFGEAFLKALAGNGHLEVTERSPE